MELNLGVDLARRLEAADASNAAACADEWIGAGGGVAAFAGPTSPLTHAVGLGMVSPVSESDLDRVEQFYRERGAMSNIDLCPLADPTLMELLGRRAYRITEFNNVLVRHLPAQVSRPEGVRIAEANEGDLWSRTMVAGFFEREDLSAEEIAIGSRMFQIPGVIACLVEVDGVAAAAATGRVEKGLISLFGDSTLPRFRGRGLHKRLIEFRLALAAELGCQAAYAATLPGSTSQRNYTRAGFQVAYTKMNMCR